MKNEIANAYLYQINVVHGWLIARDFAVQLPISLWPVEIWPNRTIWSLFEIEGTVDGVCSVETPNKKLRSKNRNAAIARHALWFATAMEISFESSSPVRIGQAFGDNGVDEEAAQVQAELKLEGRKDKIYPFLHLKLRCKNIFFFINKKN